MRKSLILVLVVALVVVAQAKPTEEDASKSDLNELMRKAKELLEKIDKENGQWSERVSYAEWDYASNLNDETLANKLNISKQAARYNKQMWQEVNAIDWQKLPDYNVRRQFSKLSVLGVSALPEENFEEFEKIISEMENIYSTAKICSFEDPEKCDLALEPELTEILATSRNPEQLKHIWSEFRKKTGRMVKRLYPRYVELSNIAAKLNNYSDNAAYWLKEYEAEDFQEQIEAIWQQLKPLYQQLHAYVRGQLRKTYGDAVVSADGPIPAHLLGNMWAQTWSNIASFTTPFPGKQQPDVTEAMVKQGYNATTIFRLAEDFFKSINLSAMPDTFWKNSILEKPQDRNLICHASAWDFYNGKDFRIKQCTRVNMEDLLTAHHEMGHVEYFIQYKDQPTIFKEGANPGFHEAVGDVMSLSVSTPKHLKKIGLLEDDATDYQAMINHLFSKGLDKIVFLPFAYMMDQWRWNVFRGKIKPEDYNCEWWNLIEEYQGLEAPVDRSEEDFDAGAKYHIIADVEYIRYYVSFIVQFQFHKALCTEAGQYNPDNPSEKPLYECDIYQSTKAGNLLKSMLEMGSSRPWQDAMEKLTGQRTMDAQGLVEYFKPLQDWLTEQNKKNNEYIGWKPSNTRTCKVEV